MRETWRAERMHTCNFEFDSRQTGLYPQDTFRTAVIPYYVDMFGLSIIAESIRLWLDESYPDSRVVLY